MYFNTPENHFYLFLIYENSQEILNTFFNSKQVLNVFHLIEVYRFENPGEN